MIDYSNDSVQLITALGLCGNDDDANNDEQRLTAQELGICSTSSSLTS